MSFDSSVAGFEDVCFALQSELVGGDVFQLALDFVAEMTLANLEVMAEVVEVVVGQCLDLVLLESR